MLKHIYRIIACLICFGLSITYFSKNIHEQKNDGQSIEEVAASTYPIIHFKYQDKLINTSFGYSANLEAEKIRDGLVPVDDSQKIVFYVKENDTVIKKADYKIKEISGKVLEKGDINTFEKQEKYIGAQFTVSAELSMGEEYCLEIDLITDKGDRIHFYTRLLKQNTEHFMEMLDFALNFHNNIIDKDKANAVIKNIEPDGSMSNTDLSYVNIHSSLDLISFGSLGPRKISNVVPIIREFTEDTAIIELNYYVMADTGSGSEKYKVSEGYRVRWTATRMYLLHYERNMEQIFDISLASISKSELKLGITANPNVDSMVSPDNSKMCFVRSNELWFYNMAVNTAYRVFSFKENNTDYIRDTNENHNIRILNMDEDGNIKFMVYGYMNRGAYEGRLAIVLYEYRAGENCIEEMLYIPVDLPYNRLKEQINEFAYINASQVYYFTINNVIYEYNMVTKQLNKIAENISNDNMVMPKKSGIIAWQESGKQFCNVLNIMNLETGKKSTITAGDGGCIKILGSIGSNIIYGAGYTKDQATMSDGSAVMPLASVFIADADNNIKKTYTTKGKYVIRATVDDNKICLNRVEKNEDGYFVPVEDDYMYNNEHSGMYLVSDSRVTEQTMTEWYLDLPSTIKISEAPAIEEVPQLHVTTETVLRLDVVPKETINYYVYSFHGLEKTFAYAGEAIEAANERMGLVFDSEGRKIWERGVAKNKADVGPVKNVTEKEAGSSTVAAMQIILAHMGITVDNADLEADQAITDVLNNHMQNKAVNITGVDLDHALYFVSKGVPVIAMKSATNAVVITGYDEETITIYNPKTGVKEVMLRYQASSIFKDMGNIFISYVKE